MPDPKNEDASTPPDAAASTPQQDAPADSSLQDDSKPDPASADDTGADNTGADEETAEADKTAEADETPADGDDAPDEDPEAGATEPDGTEKADAPGEPQASADSDGTGEADASGAPDESDETTEAEAEAATVAIARSKPDTPSGDTTDETAPTDADTDADADAATVSIVRAKPDTTDADAQTVAIPVVGARASGTPAPAASAPGTAPAPDTKGGEKADDGATVAIPAADAKTVAIPAVAAPTAEKTDEKAAEKSGVSESPPSAADAATVQIPVRAHVPNKRQPQRIEPRQAEPPRPEPQRFQPQPTPQRIESSPRRGGRRWALAATVAGLLVVAAVAVGALLVYLDHRADNSPEARIRASVDTFVDALAAGDLATLRTSTCGGLAEFYATVDPEKFTEIHDLAVQQGSVPVVTSVDKVQITDDHAIVQVTAHPTGTPTDVTERTFDLSDVGGVWKVCGE